MKIPAGIVQFLDGATVAFAVTRDDKLVPLVHFVLSWAVDEDRELITCLLPPVHNKELIASLEDNGRFAMTVLGSTTGLRASDPPNPSVDFHECYQLKGDYVRSRPANDKDMSLVGQKGEQFHTLFHPLLGFSDAACRALFRNPALAMTFRVREIYDQTPGPGAGSKLQLEGA